MFDVLAGSARAAATLLSVIDVVEERADDEVPSWCEARGWTAFLSALDEKALDRCEREGLGACVADLPGAPAELVNVASNVERACAIPVSIAPPAGAIEDGRSVPERKRRQLGSILDAVAPMAQAASRIVDVGSGRGHFARMAAARFDRRTVGLDRSETYLRSAVELAEAHGSRGATGDVAFVAFDAVESALELEAGDLAIGLHACGELGDRLVTAAASAGCDLALVSCCFQKIAGATRLPLSRAAAGLVLRREVLGLANLTSRAMGVETSLEATLEARRARHALVHLLRSRGIAVQTGEEMRGLNRRRARAGFAALAAAALELRGLAPASATEIREREAEAAVGFARARRLGLPRSMLSRLVETALVLDRAAALREAGQEVAVTALFDVDTTPRNLALFASADAARLPATTSR